MNEEIKNEEIKNEEIKRICARCGQPVNPQRDSWRGNGAGIEHTSCPVSEAVKSLPTVRREEAATIQFITTTQAAKMLSVSVDTIQRRIKRGLLPAKHLRGTEGGRGTILVNQADVLALLEDVEVTA